MGVDFGVYCSNPYCGAVGREVVGDIIYGLL
jgi:hypothetical protein